MAHPTWVQIDIHVFVEYQAKCVYCGLDGSTDPRIFYSMHTDHLIPISAGGSDDRSNKVPSCGGCNLLKGRFDPSSHDRDRLTISDGAQKRVPRSEEAKKELIEAVKHQIAPALADYRQSYDDLVRRLSTATPKSPN